MDDESHVRPIDAHAEGDRRDNDVGRFVQERVLMPVTDVVIKPGVVRHRPDARSRQPCRELVDLPARLAVDDAGVVAMTSDDLLKLLLEARPRGSTR